jgi:pimeloyl-ACP methyl ester carboxylesterase
VRAIEEQTAEVAGVPTFWRTTPADGPPTLFLHGNPTSSEDWMPFLERVGGVAPDLPGFGRSGKRGDFDYSIGGYERFLRAFVEHLGLPRFSLLVHDWGAVGLALAQAMPHRIERLVVVNAVPFMPGYEWHPVARLWRRRIVGELVMGSATRRGTRAIARRGRPWWLAMPEELVDPMWRHFDPGTQRAILRLYRSGDPEVLAGAGRRLGELTAPALVVWGGRDPFLPAVWGERYAERLPHAELRAVPDAGHWPWLDRPGLVEDVCNFLGARG